MTRKNSERLRYSAKAGKVNDGSSRNRLETARLFKSTQPCGSLPSSHAPKASYPNTLAGHGPPYLAFSIACRSAAWSHSAGRPGATRPNQFPRFYPHRRGALKRRADTRLAFLRIRRAEFHLHERWAEA